MLTWLKARLVILAVAATLGIGAWGTTSWAAWPRQTCAPISPKQVAALFDRWNASLAKSPDAVVKNYADDAMLLPTKENGPLVGHAAMHGYFVHFLQLHPTGKIVTRTIMIACNMVFDAGLYNFTVDGSQPGSRTEIKARFTFVYERRGGQWLIVQHHSSVLPVPGS